MSENSKLRLNFSLDFRIITLVLVAIIVLMLAMWRPWGDATSSDRTIRVTGESVVKAEPDEFVFYPSYQFKNADRDAALVEVSKKSDEVVAKLKELGVVDQNIKTNSGGYNYDYFREEDNTTTYTLQLTVTVNSREHAQTVQDYLVSTSPVGSVSPQATFSEALRKQLESQARDEATKDARAKADQSAGNLGFKVAKVKSVEDGAGFGDVIPLGGEVALDSAASSAMAPKLGVQPGQNDLNYSVTVVYYVR